MGRRDLLFMAAVASGILLVVSGLARPFRADRPATTVQVEPSDMAVVAKVDAEFRRTWEAKHLQPAESAPELTRMRRLSLALTGSIPSLEDVRRFESRPPLHRVDAWLEDLLKNRRTSDYLAERFARAFVGTEDGPFLRFRRRRFASWLSDAILANRPYDAIVRDMITDTGLWTDHPATNFVTVTFDPAVEYPDPERLAARSSRAFLGVRLDCAQCHDHPFQPWKQGDFRGLAAFFGGLRSGLRGTQDAENHYTPGDPKTKAPVAVMPRVPFLPELQPATGTPRQQLASWITDPRNPSFARATVNRVWALMCGLPLVEPIDDLPAPGDIPKPLDLLAEDFSSHHYDLHRLIRVIAATEAFQRDSAGASLTEDHRETWANFPLSRLRPEQVAGSLYQVGSISTVDARSHWLMRLVALTSRNDFVTRYGDAGEDEFDSRGGTILQRLLLMNGDLVGEKTKVDGLNAAGRIAGLAPDDASAVEAAYLVVLTRRPSVEEAKHFAERLAGSVGDERKMRVADLCWTLLNSTEFSWNY